MRRRHYIYLAACGLYLATPGRVTLAQLSAPTKVFSNAYHVTATGSSDGAVPDTQAGALEVVTNGIIDHGTGNGQVDGFDTWQSDNQGVGTDFVGLGYDSAATFDVVTVALGNQFVDGGDWQEPPKVYILKNPIMNSDMVRPEISPNWVEVPAVSFNLPEEEEHLFDSLVTQGPGGMVHFQLQGTAAERTGWGWAVGGVDGNENGADIFHFISVTELMASGEPAAPPAIIPPATPQPMNVVANSYHSPNYEGEDFTDLRGEVFQAITNGVSDFGDAGTPGDGFDTWENDASGTSTDFVGLQYNSLVEFDTIQIDLGFQFPDGGDWEEMPKVYILKNPVDTNQADPESDPNWVEVAATETTGHVFDSLVVPPVGESLSFQLTGSASERTGWGWAVGGVDGNENDTGRFNFISVTEVSATGTVVSAGLEGDFNSNGVLDAGDLDLLAQAQVGGDTSFDLTGDSATNFDDRIRWVRDLKHTWIGDANLDGEFNSTDFVSAFTAGKYESGGAATWSEGDWDGDLDFDSGDFVAAFSDGGYEAGVRASVAAVPEPASGMLAIMSLLGLARWRRRAN